MGMCGPGNLDRQAAEAVAVQADIAVAGAHGGAGATTLAILLGSERDLGVVPRHSRNWFEVCVQGRPLVLVARTTMAGAVSATSAIELIRDLGGAVAALALVKDGMPEPVAATHRFRALRPQVGGVVRVPFVPALRSPGDPVDVTLPRSALKALAELRALATSSAGGDQPTLPEGA